MVPVYHSSVDRHLVTTADFRNSSLARKQNRVAIFGHPYDMIFTIPCRVTAGFSRLHNTKDATASRRLKAEDGL